MRNQTKFEKKKSNSAIVSLLISEEVKLEIQTQMNLSVRQHSSLVWPSGVLFNDVHEELCKLGDNIIKRLLATFSQQLFFMLGNWQQLEGRKRDEMRGEPAGLFISSRERKRKSKRKCPPRSLPKRQPW